MGITYIDKYVMALVVQGMCYIDEGEQLVNVCYVGVLF
jgi:hypothetical protein